MNKDYHNTKPHTHCAKCEKPECIHPKFVSIYPDDSHIRAQATSRLLCCRGFCAEAEMGLMMLIPHNNFYPLWTLCVLKLIIFQRKWWMDKILSAGLRYQLKPAAGVSWTWDWDDWELCKEVSGLIIIIIISTSWNEKQKMLNIASFPSGIMADKLKINPR